MHRHLVTGGEHVRQFYMENNISSTKDIHAGNRPKSLQTWYQCITPTEPGARRGRVGAEVTWCGEVDGDIEVVAEETTVG